MLRESVTIDQVVDLLNECFHLDAQAMEQLINARVPCNKALGDHPTVQVQPTDDGDQVGLIGILNGLFGADKEGCGVIQYCHESGDVAPRFIGFRRRPAV